MNPIGLLRAAPVTPGNVKVNGSGMKNNNDNDDNNDRNKRRS